MQVNKIAITGADGFIGSFVVKKFKQKKAKITIFNYKKHILLDSESLKSFVKNQDVIIHLAGVNRATNEELLKVNTLGTMSLLEAVLKYSPTTRIIFASTFQVYLPQSYYGLSKKFAEYLLMFFARNYNIKSIVLRLSNVYGPGGKPFYNSVIATFAHLFKNGGVLSINGDGSTKRDFIYVEDVAEAFIKAAQRDFRKNFQTIDICSGKETSLNQVIKILKRLSGKKIEVVYNKGAKEKPWLTSDKNYKMAEKLLKWHPKTNLKKGLTAVMNHG